MLQNSYCPTSAKSEKRVPYESSSSYVDIFPAVSRLGASNFLQCSPRSSIWVVVAGASRPPLIGLPLSADMFREDAIYHQFFSTIHSRNCPSAETLTNLLIPIIPIFNSTVVNFSLMELWSPSDYRQRWPQVGDSGIVDGLSFFPSRTLVLDLISGDQGLGTSRTPLYLFPVL